MNVLKIVDFSDKVIDTAIDLDAMEDIKKINVSIISGDEVLYVEYMDGRLETIDSCPSGRIYGFFDGSYTLFDRETGYSHITKEWLSLRNSYKRQTLVIGQDAADTLLLASVFGLTPHGEGI